jgi:hypothetical protein
VGEEVGVIRVGAREFRTPFRGECRPLTAAERERLRASIRKLGVQDAVVVDEDDNVLDGHNRLEIAEELDIPPADIPFEVKVGLTLKQRQAIAAELNEARRQLTAEELEEAAAKRRVRVAAGKKAGKTTRQMSAEEGVSQPQIIADLKKVAEEALAGDNPLSPASAPKTATGTDGKDYPVTLDERLRRRALIAEAIRSDPEKSNKQIHRELEVSQHVVSSVRAKLQEEDDRAADEEEDNSIEADAARDMAGYDEGNPPSAATVQLAPSRKTGAVFDQMGRHVSERLESVFAAAKEFRSKVNDLGRLRTWIETARKTPAGAKIPQNALRLLDDLQAAVKFAAPYVICPLCDGVGCRPGSDGEERGCRRRGWLEHLAYTNLPSELKAACEKHRMED